MTRDLKTVMALFEKLNRFFESGDSARVISNIHETVRPLVEGGDSICSLKRSVEAEEVLNLIKHFIPRYIWAAHQSPEMVPEMYIDWFDWNCSLFFAFDTQVNPDEREDFWNPYEINRSGFRSIIEDAMFACEEEKNINFEVVAENFRARVSNAFAEFNSEVQREARTRSKRLQEKSATLADYGLSRQLSCFKIEGIDFNLQDRFEFRHQDEVDGLKHIAEKLRPPFIVIDSTSEFAPRLFDVGSGRHFSGTTVLPHEIILVEPPGRPMKIGRDPKLHENAHALMSYLLSDFFTDKKKTLAKRTVFVPPMATERSNRNPSQFIRYFRQHLPGPIFRLIKINTKGKNRVATATTNLNVEYPIEISLFVNGILKISLDQKENQ